MTIAITRKVSPAIASCELTHLDRVPIDYEAAARQHADYEELLRELGCTVISLDPEPLLPDSVFVEDAAIVLDEVAVITRPGAASRRPEVDSIEATLKPLREIRKIVAPATLDGGDVLVIGKTIRIGLTTRTDQAGVDQVRSTLAPFGYSIQCLDLRHSNARASGCLHLKTAVTSIGKNTVLINPAWVDPEAFADLEVVEVDPDEPYASNALLVNGTVVVSTAFPRTRRRLERVGFDVRVVDATELAKAEGGLTCCSLIVSE